MPSTARPRRALAVLALSASLVLAGCGGGDEPSTEEGPEGQDTADGSTLAGQWPFTGLPAEGDAPDHPPMLVKIDNTSSSTPQVGLGKADLVVEQLVEGGSTRLAAFFYSQVPKTVGPVRSFRATDIGIVKPAEAVLVASGGAGPTVTRVKREGIRTVTDGGTGFSRDSSRTSPYDLVMDLPKLAKTLKPAQPDPYLPWGTSEDFPRGQKARSISAMFSGGHTTQWQFQGGRYVNQGSHAASGDTFEPETVLVLRVPVGDAGYLDPAGNPVPESKLTGKGQAMVFHNGTMVRGTWSKDGLGDDLSLETRAGELTVPAGKVWIELVPTNGGDVTFGK